MKHPFFTPLSSVTAEKPMDNANNDDKELVALGYKPSFKREFTNLATVISSKMHFMRPLKTQLITFPRLALRLVSWYEIIGCRRCIYSLNIMNRDCLRALQPHSTLHYFLEALHQWVCRTLINMNAAWFIDSGSMVLDSWSYDVLHAWF